MEETETSVAPAPPSSDVFTHTPTIGKLATALAAAQLKYEPLKATSVADAEKYKYKYADLAAVFAAVQPALAAQGIAILQGVAMQRPQGSSGLVVSVETRFVLGDEWIATTLRLPSGEVAPQKVGSLVSYLRRYALLAMAGVAAEDDDGVSASPAPRRQEPTRPPATAKPVTAPAPSVMDQSEWPDRTAEAPKKAAAAKPAPKQQPVGGPGSITASERGLLFRTAREQSLSEAQVKALITALFGYTSTSQILQGAQFHKVINTMENPGDHGVAFSETGAVYTRDKDVNALPEGA